MDRQKQRRQRQNKKGKKYPVWVRILVICLVLVIAAGIRLHEYNQQSAVQDTAQEAGETGQPAEGELTVYYLDVGQADCTILVSDGEALLIDAGNNDDEELVVDFLEQLELDRLVYAVGTHSHEDHVGGLDSVIENCDPAYVMLPEEKSETKTYRDVLAAIEEQEVELLRPEIGDTYEFGSASFQILGPSGEKKDSPNGYSICLMVTFGENRFLFTGDAEAAEEQEMMELGIPLECDVFQAGHHGSSTSNTKAFLEVADPVYTVISCGEGNSYGHPHAEVLAEMEDQDIQIYRTDRQGTITAVSDGKNIHWRAE